MVPGIRLPDYDQLRRISAENHLTLHDDELADYSTLLADMIPILQQLDQSTARPPMVVCAHRDPGYRPGRSEDPLNAIARKCSVRITSQGPLAGKTVGLKDNISLAGVPMECGSRVLEGYVPDMDATVVTRLLEAGAEIVAKLNMDDFGLSGTGDTSAFGPVLNPHNQSYLAGGSSAGAAAAVVHGDVDIALGTDQGGSVREPAAWCGAVGLKPTYGLLPYTGIVAIENTLDHLGPIARNVPDIALALAVIAGKDPLDPRQDRVPTGRYISSLVNDLSGTRIGVIREGFGMDKSDPAVDDAVRKALSEYERLGATAREISIPTHRSGLPIFFAILVEGMTALIRGEGLGHLWKGFYDTRLARALAVGRRTRGNDFSPTVKLLLLLGTWLGEQYQTFYYAKAQNLRRELQTAYDQALNDFHVLALPTTPMTAFPVIHNPDRKTLIARGWGIADNVAPFNVTGHPALTLPCGKVNGLPVGLMLVARHFDECSLLRTAYAFEKNVQWESL